MLIESDSEHGHLSPTLPAGVRSHTGACLLCSGGAAGHAARRLLRANHPLPDRQEV